MMDIIEYLKPVFWALLRVCLVALPLLIFVPFLLWWERRLLGWLQDRLGPNRVGNITWSKTSKWVPPFLRGKKTRLYGILQAFADGIKLILKEDITPKAVDRLVFTLAPILALIPPIALVGAFPWGPPELFGKLTPVADINVGVLYLFAVSSLGVYGIVLGGYASNNKYSLLGGLRSSAQMISYELSMGMALAGMVLASSSLKMTEIVNLQLQPLWGYLPFLQNWNILTPFGFISGVIFLVCMVAETNRAPFDLPEAENELIAGYHTEYSSMKFASYFMGEYASMLAFSAIFTTIFLGGYGALISFDGINTAAAWAAPLIFIFKTLVMFTVFVWTRQSLPRLRYDQLMSLGWKSLLPAAVANFLMVALWIVTTKVFGAAIGWGITLASYAVVIAIYVAASRVALKTTDPLASRKVILVNPKKGDA
jgi:NADH-quinone oxidoreductase subunit H